MCIFRFSFSNLNFTELKQSNKTNRQTEHTKKKIKIKIVATPSTKWMSVVVAIQKH